MARKRKASRSRLVVGVVVLGLVATSIAAAISASVAAAAPRQTSEPELRFGLAGAEGTFCPPAAQWGPSGIQVAAGIYDTLTVPNEQGRFVPYLAESVVPDATFTQWTIALRDGISFHDHEALDAAAVKLNLDAFAGRVPTIPPAPVFSATLGFVADTVVVDRLHLLVQLTSPVADFPEYLYLGGRMAIAAPAQLRSPRCATDLIGTGPFALTSFRPDEIVASKNPSYWQPGFPKAKRITFTTIFDATQRTAQLRSGGVNLIAQSNGREADKIAGFKGHYPVLAEAPGYRATHSYVLNVTKAPFNDREARLAVATAIDRGSLNAIISDSHLEGANGFMDTDAPGYEKDAGYPAASTDRARELVTRVNTKTGGELKLTILIDADGDHLAEATELATELTSAGMVPTIVQSTPQQYAPEVAAGHFDLILADTEFGGNAGNCDADTIPWWASASPANVGGFHDERIDALLGQARAATTLPEAQTACTALNEAMAAQAYVLPVVFLQGAIAARPGVDLTLPRLPDNGGKPLVVGGRFPVLGLKKS